LVGQYLPVDLAEQRAHVTPLYSLSAQVSPRR
jgi:hypothetical protein